MTFLLQTHVKGQLDKGRYKVFSLSCSSGVHTQRLMDELRPYLMNEHRSRHDFIYAKVISTIGAIQLLVKFHPLHTIKNETRDKSH